MASGGGVGGATDLGLAFLRLAGIGLAYDGYKKAFIGSMDEFASDVGGIGFPVPLAFAWAAVLSAIFGGAFVAVGLFTRAAAGFAAITLFVAAFIAHAKDPFETREMALLYLVIMLCIACLGAGKWSFDGVVRKKA